MLAAAEDAHKQIFPHPPSSQLTGPKYDGKGISISLFSCRFFF